MGGGLIILAGAVGTRGGVLTHGCSVGVNGAYVDMSICVIFWLS